MQALWSRFSGRAGYSVREGFGPLGSEMQLTLEDSSLIGVPDSAASAEARVIAALADSAIGADSIPAYISVGWVSRVLPGETAVHYYRFRRRDL